MRYYRFYTRRVFVNTKHGAISITGLWIEYHPEQDIAVRTLSCYPLLYDLFFLTKNWLLHCLPSLPVQLAILRITATSTLKVKIIGIGANAMVSIQLSDAVHIRIFKPEIEYFTVLLYPFSP